MLVWKGILRIEIKINIIAQSDSKYIYSFKYSDIYISYYSLITLLIMETDIKNLLLEVIPKGIQLSPLPVLLDKDANVPHAPKRNPQLNKD